MHVSVSKSIFRLKPSSQRYIGAISVTSVDEKASFSPVKIQFMKSTFRQNDWLNTGNARI